MVKISIFFLQIITIITIFGCNSNNQCENIPEITNPINLNIERLESSLLNISNKEELKFFIESEPEIAEFFLHRSDFPNDSIFINETFRKFSNPYLDSLGIEVNRVYGELSQLKKELEEAFSNYKYYFPDARLPEIKTIVSGFGHDMLVSDTLIIIGLDYWMGEGAKYRPMGLYNYVLKRYEPEYIVPTIMLLYGIDGKININNKNDHTMLSDMISYGKAFYFAKSVMPCTPDSILIWYSGEEWEGVIENQRIIWSHFLQNELLYETSHIIKKKYVDDRPKTYEIGPKCPGRISTWLGWEIVKDYMKEEDVSLQELMKTTDAQMIFNKSKYKPD